MRRAAVAAVVLVLALAQAPAALADGDPASDVLLTQDSFLPYAPPVRPRLKAALARVLARARQAGYPMKVALVLVPQDLGAYTTMFNKAQDYADLLTRELGSLNPHSDPVKAVHLLVVMPGGFGGNNLGDRIDEALNPVPIKAQAQSDGLAQSAIAAVPRLATRNGHPVKTPPEATLELGAGSASVKRKGTSPLVFAAPALVLFAGLALAGRIARRRDRRTPE